MLGIAPLMDFLKVLLITTPSTRATVDGDWQGVQTVALKMGDVVKEYTITPNSADDLG